MITQRFFSLFNFYRLGKKKSDPLERRALKVLSGESDDEEDEEDFDEDPEDEIHFMKLHGSMSQPVSQF